MSGATRAFFFEVLADVLGTIGSTGAAHVMIGGIAESVHLGRMVDETEDLDLFVRAEDADMLLGVFAHKGYATHVRDERWIYKVAKPDVTADLIFSAGGIRLDDDLLGRSLTKEVDGIALPVVPAEDLVVMKVMFDAPDEDERKGHWYSAMQLLRRAPIDGDYLVERARMHAPRRVLSLLLYAIDAGVAVPDDVVLRLMDEVRGQPAGAGDEMAEV